MHLHFMAEFAKCAKLRRKMKKIKWNFSCSYLGISWSDFVDWQESLLDK